MPYDPELDEAPASSSRKYWTLPRLPSTFEGRLLGIGTLLVLIEGARFVLVFTQELKGYLWSLMNLIHASITWLLSFGS